MNNNQEINSAIYPIKRWEQGAIRTFVLKKIKDFYQDFADVIAYDHWFKFGITFKDYKLNDTRIFRGQSNSLSNREFNFWEINSNFNRSGYKLMNLSDYFLNLSRAKNEISKYGVESIEEQNGNNVIDLMAFLQHKGIPTPLIDFTKDPVTALYFALSDIPVRNPLYPEALYHTIIEINLKVLNEHFSFNELILTENVTLLNLHELLKDYKIYIEPKRNHDEYFPVLAICSSDKQKYNLVNRNLSRQDGTSLSGIYNTDLNILEFVIQ